MPATKIPAPELTRVGSHTVSARSYSGVDHEECFGYFATSWRGTEVVVTVEARRDLYSRQDEPENWSDWRIWAASVRPEVSDIARSRLSEACTPLMRAWLDSDEYGPSRQQAFGWHAKQTLRKEAEALFRDDNWSRETRRVLERYPGEFHAETMDRLLTACEALDAFGAAYNAIP